MSSAWSEKETIALLINMIKQENPDLVVKGWKQIAERMEPLGKNENVCKKRWNVIRKEFTDGADPQDADSKDASGEAATPKRKRGGKADNATEDGSPAKKRTPKTKKKATTKTAAQTAPMDETDETELKEEQAEE